MKYIFTLIICLNFSFAFCQDTISLPDSLGKKITLIGKAINAKLGAFLLLDNGSYVWIKNKDSWPSKFYNGNLSGVYVKVTGTLIEAFDKPVYIHNEGDLPRAGIPVPPGTDLKKASHRYLFEKYKYEIITK